MATYKACYINYRTQYKIKIQASFFKKQEKSTIIGITFFHFFSFLTCHHFYLLYHQILSKENF